MVFLYLSYYCDCINYSLTRFQILLLTCCITLFCRLPKFNDNHCNADEEDPTIYWDPTAKPERRPRRPKPKKRIMEPEFFANLKNRKCQEMEMKTVIR